MLQRENRTKSSMIFILISSIYIIVILNKKYHITLSQKYYNQVTRSLIFRVTYLSRLGLLSLGNLAQC